MLAVRQWTEIAIFARLKMADTPAAATTRPTYQPVSE